jgi:hypothetical protein
LTISLQALVAAAIFFVWVVRYNNITEEFKFFRFSPSVRDLVGILKLTFALMLLIGIERVQIAIVGALGIALLMLGAFVTHLRVRNPFFKMLPSLSLFILSTVIALTSLDLMRNQHA